MDAAGGDRIDSHTYAHINRQGALPFNASDVARFPTLALALPGGPKLELHGRDYLLPTGATDAATGLPLYALAITPVKPLNWFILGQAVLRKYYTELDAQGGRLGFAPTVADCHGAVGL